MPAPQSKFPPNLFESMKTYMSKAIQNRETFYVGLAEAAEDVVNRTPGSPYSNAPDVAAAQQQYQSSPKGKELIGNNRWHMVQAMMFGVGSIAQTLLTISRDVYMIRKMMEDEYSQKFTTPRPTIPPQRGQ